MNRFLVLGMVIVIGGVIVLTRPDLVISLRETLNNRKYREELTKFQ